MTSDIPVQACDHVRASILPSRYSRYQRFASALVAFSILLDASTGASAQNQPRPPERPRQITPALPEQLPQISVGKLPTPTPTGILTAVERGFDLPSKSIAQSVESVLSVFGTPNAYVIGNDISGALLVGGRFGTGFLHSTVAPPNPVRWRALSLGLGLGANYGRVVMLVYGIDRLEDIYGLYASLEGNFHLVLGANTSIVTRGPVSIIIISSGLGLRLSGDVSGILIDRDN
jgi:hypothetical protein